MKKISVAIMTYNEEKRIRRCLESVAAVADEIVVVDSFSTDKTKQICKDFGVNKFIEHKFEGYIQQRLYSINSTQYDYVLAMDADEVLSEKLCNSILDEKKLGFTYSGYKFNRLNNFCGYYIKHGEWYPDTKMRLFNKNNIKVAGRNPHDKIIVDSKNKVKFLKGDLLHYSFLSIEGYITKGNTFSNIQSEYVYKNKKFILVKMIVKPIFNFLVSYIFRLGFLDGTPGFVIAANNAFVLFNRYSKAWLKKQKDNE